MATANASKRVFTIRSYPTYAQRNFVEAGSSLELLAKVMDSLSEQIRREPKRAMWGVTVRTQGGRLVCDVVYDGSEEDAEKVERFVAVNAERMKLFSGSESLTGGDRGPDLPF